MSAAAEILAARRRRVRARAGRAAAGVLVVGVVGGAIALLVAPDASSPTPRANDAVPLGSAAVQARDLVDTQDVEGTLGYAGARSIAAPAAGTVTRLRAEGTTVGRGRSLLSIDAQATGWVLYGRRPMYRDLGPGATNGSDVRQLEANLAALGYDPGTIDADWTAATTAAVQDFQEDRGLDETGTLRHGEVVVSDGPARVGAHRLEVGDAARAGAPVTTLTTRTPVVTARLAASDVASVHRGDAVDVTLPDGRAIKGSVSTVGAVATAGSEGEEDTVALRVALRGGRGRLLDGAPVTLTLALASTKAPLAVPLTALVATGASRYAVELAGSRRLVGVTLGASAEGWVEVRAPGLKPGDAVVVPK